MIVNGKDMEGVSRSLFQGICILLERNWVRSWKASVGIHDNSTDNRIGHFPNINLERYSVTSWIQKLWKLMRFKVVIRSEVSRCW